MDPVKTLYKLSEKTAPGQSPEFTPTHVLLALLIIQEEQVGRKQLSNELNLGEGTIRNLISRLQDEKLVSSSRQGLLLAEKGRSFLKTLNKLLSGLPIDETNLTVSKYNYAVVVRGKASKINLGIEQRDRALLSGARGATTLIYTGSKYLIPGVNSKLDNLIQKNLYDLNPKTGDVIIIGTGETLFLAKIGAYTAGMDLIK